MATAAEIKEKAEAVKAALQAFYGSKITEIDEEVVFWRDSVTSPLSSLSEGAVTTASADVALSLESLGVDIG